MNEEVKVLINDLLEEDHAPVMAAQYVPLKTKIAAIETALENVFDVDENGFLKLDLYKKKIYLAESIVILYSNIELTDDDYLNYDTLVAGGILDSIIESVGQNGKNDCKEFISLFEESIENKLRENSVESTMKELRKDLMISFDEFSKKVWNLIDDANPKQLLSILADSLVNSKDGE